MGRIVGSISSTESKNIAEELNNIAGSKYSDNIDILRLIELLVAQRISEQVKEFPNDLKIEEKIVEVEIPLFGNLKIKPRTFQEVQRLSNTASLHFDFEFTPSSGFRTDIIRSYTSISSPLADELSELYTKRLKELYARLKNGEWYHGW